MGAGVTLLFTWQPRRRVFAWGQSAHPEGGVLAAWGDQRARTTPHELPTQRPTGQPRRGGDASVGVGLGGGCTHSPTREISPATSNLRKSVQKKH